MVGSRVNQLENQPTKRVFIGDASIEVPIDFEELPMHSGFGRLDLGISIVMSAVDVASEQLGSAMSAVELEKKGMQLLEKKSHRFPFAEATVIHVLQKVNDQYVFAKWIGLIGNQSRTWIVTATFPRALNRQFSLLMEQIIYTFRIEDKFTEERTILSAIDFEPTPEFKLAFAAKSYAIFTGDGSLPAKPEIPTIVLSLGSWERHLQSQRTQNDVEELAIRKAITDTFSSFQDVHLEVVTTENIHEDCVIHDGSGIDRKLNEVTYLFQYLFFGKSAYAILAGMVSQRKMSGVRDLFLQNATTIKIKDDAKLRSIR